MSTDVVFDIAADAFRDAVEILGIIEVLEAGNNTATEALN